LKFLYVLSLIFDNSYTHKINNDKNSEVQKLEDTFAEAKLL